MIPLRDNVPTRAFPVVTAALIAVNVLVYVLVQHGGLTVESGPAGSTFYLRAGVLTVAMTNEQLDASAAAVLATDAVPAGGVR